MGGRDLRTNNYNWTAEDDLPLIELWTAGKMSILGICAEMSQRLRFPFNKNQVVGRAHRLVAKGRLQGKKSPIKNPAGPKAGGLLRRASDDSKAIEHSNAAAAHRNVFDAADKADRRGAFPLDASPRRNGVGDQYAVDKFTRLMSSTFIPKPRAGAPCCWPGEKIGPGRGWTFCGAPGEPGRPYCAAHVAVAYIPKPEKMQGAAP